MPDNKLACPRCHRVDDTTDKSPDIAVGTMVNHLAIRHQVYDWQAAVAEIEWHNTGEETTP